MADFLLLQGLAAASLLPLAKTAGISDRSLLYFFEERSKVITAILTLPSLRLKTRLDIRTITPPLPLAGGAAGWYGWCWTKRSGPSCACVSRSHRRGREPMRCAIKSAKIWGGSCWTESPASQTAPAKPQRCGC